MSIASFGFDKRLSVAERKCEICGRVFYLYTMRASLKKTCSEKCKQEHVNRYWRSKARERKDQKTMANCEECGKEYEKKQFSNRKYCGSMCRRKAGNRLRNISRSERRRSRKPNYVPNETECQKCPLIDDCRRFILDPNFTPYCFPYKLPLPPGVSLEAPIPNWRHSQYLKEVANGKEAAQVADAVQAG